jgi:hypothetical protein
MMGRRRRREASRVALMDVHAFEAQLVDVGDENDRGLHRDAKQRQEAEHGGDAEGSVGELEGDQVIQ